MPPIFNRSIRCRWRLVWSYCMGESSCFVLERISNSRLRVSFGDLNIIYPEYRLAEILYGYQSNSQILAVLPQGLSQSPKPRSITKDCLEVWKASCQISVKLKAKIVKRLHSNCLRQWDILDKRLSSPEQSYIALPDRPTLADLSYLPFAMPWMFTFLGVAIKDWPNIQVWSERMLAREAVRKTLARGPTYGH